MRKGTGIVAVAGIGLALGGTTGCDLLQGLQPATLVETGGGGQGGTGGSGTTAGTGGTTTATPCEPGTSIPCYSGPEGTEGVAMCHGGTRACKADGTGYEDTCQGEVVPAPETCANTGDEDCDDLDCARWARVYGDASEQVPLGIGTDALGNVVVLGKFKGAIAFGNPAIISSGGWDFFVVKVDPTGSVLWYKQFGDAAEQEVATLGVDPAGNVVLAGHRTGTLDFGGMPLSSGDLFIAKLDSMGGHVWSKSFTATLPGRPNVAAAPDGSALLWTDFFGSANFGTGPLTADPDTKAVVAGLDGTTGATNWLTTFVSTGQPDLPGSPHNHTQARSLATDASGNISLVGVFSGKTLNLGGQDIQELPSGGNTFLARFDKLGTHAWSFGNVPFGAVSVDPLGGVALSALDDADGFAPCVSAYVQHYSNIGDKQWDMAFTCYDQGKDAKAIHTASDIKGDVVVALLPWDDVLDFDGNTLPPAGTDDLVLGKLDGADGHALWSRRFGVTASAQAAPVVATAPNGDILLAAQVSGTIDVGTGPIVTKGQDLLIARFAP